MAYFQCCEIHILCQRIHEISPGQYGVIHVLETKHSEFKSNSFTVIKLSYCVCKRNTILYVHNVELQQN